MSRRSNMGAAIRRRRIAILYRAQEGICAYCTTPVMDPEAARNERLKLPLGLRYHTRPADPTLDHVLPRAHGGSNALGNLLMMHSCCNVKRGTGPLPDCAKVMWDRVRRWLQDELGHIPEPRREAA